MRFSAVVGARANYLDLKRGFTEKLEELSEITEEVARRIETERVQIEERKSTLQGRLDDPHTPAALKMLAEQELARLDVVAFVATEEEQAAFLSAEAEAKQMLQNVGVLQRRFKEALVEAQTALSDMRREVLGDQNAELRPRWLDSKRRDFEKLC